VTGLSLQGLKATPRIKESQSNDTFITTPEIETNPLYILRTQN